MSRRFGSFRWLATQSVVTRTSGCAYSVMRNSSSREYRFERTVFRASGCPVGELDKYYRDLIRGTSPGDSFHDPAGSTASLEARRSPSGFGRLSGLESAAACLEFYSKNPVVVKPFVAKPFIERFAVRRLELDKHFAFDHVDLNAPHSDSIRRGQAHGQMLGALPRQASQCVQRNVAWHELSRPKFLFAKSNHIRNEKSCNTMMTELATARRSRNRRSVRGANISTVRRTEKSIFLFPSSVPLPLH